MWIRHWPQQQIMLIPTSTSGFPRAIKCSKQMLVCHAKNLTSAPHISLNLVLRLNAFCNYLNLWLPRIFPAPYKPWTSRYPSLRYPSGKFRALRPCKDQAMIAIPMRGRQPDTLNCSPGCPGRLPGTRSCGGVLSDGLAACHLHHRPYPPISMNETCRSSAPHHSFRLSLFLHEPFSDCLNSKLALPLSLTIVRWI